MLSALRLLNPWVGLAILVGLVASHLFVFVYGNRVGSSFEKVACEKRVTVIKDQINEKNKEIERLNSAWEKAIALVQDTYNNEITKSEQETADLESKVAGYEILIQNDTDCHIGQSDLDRVRVH